MQSRTFLILLLSSLLIACTADNDTNENNTTESDMSTHDHSQHEHGLLDISTFGENTPIPTIKVTASEDPMTGWNIHISTENFLFTPEKVNQENTANEGHAHIYIDGFKFSRVYSQWYHLKQLTPGEHTLRITLNSNDHSLIGYQDKEISASVTLVQKK
ncbi:MAG: hypothetical protein ACI9NY_000309 [Kiritimatiellia bacterium]|jgi:hypothetical protein